jgi:hypothetical protein
MAGADKRTVDRTDCGALANLPLVWLPLLAIPGVRIGHRLNKLPLLLTFAGVYLGSWTLASYVPLVDGQLAAEMFRAPFVQAAIAAFASVAATLLGAGQRICWWARVLPTGGLSSSASGNAVAPRATGLRADSVLI